MRAAALAAFALAACNQGGIHHLAIGGTLGVPAPAALASNVLFVEVAVDGVSGARLVVDTGSPLTFLDPAAFPGVTIPAAVTHVDALTIGGVTVHQAPVIGEQVLAALAPSLNGAGILGANVICQFPTRFDYRGAAVQLGAAPSPDGVETPGNELGFHAEGGGRGRLAGFGTIDFVASRIPVLATIEGVAHRFIVDTGASLVVLRSALSRQLTSDGRAVLDNLPVALVGGTASVRATRLRSLEVAGAKVLGVAALDGADSLLDGLSSEVGYQVDGLVGGTFLREFLVTIDYPAGVLHLQRYSTRDHIVDEFQRIGVLIRSAPGAAHAYAIGQLLPGTDAATKGFTVGTLLVSVDGQPLDGLDENAADRLFLGPTGTLRRVQTDAQTVDVRCDDLLPL